MYYELYIDVFFLENFLMDYLLLLFVRRMLRCTATHKCICLGAVIGAFLTCLVVVIPIPYVFMKFILFHVIVNTCMIRAGLKIKTNIEFAKAYILFYIGSFLWGGVLEALQSNVRTGSLFFGLVIIGYYVVTGLWEFLIRHLMHDSYHCEVELYFQGKCICVKALIDTGNLLCEPISGVPVHILNQKEAQNLMSKDSIEGIRYIPYHSIGKKEGVLLARYIDCMRIRGKEDCWIEKPLIGIGEEMVSLENDYQLILNPKAF